MNLGVAVLGTGRLGGRYIDIVKEADGVDMKAVAEPREEQVAPLKMSHPDVDFVADYRELLDRDDIHMVIGTLPHWLHKQAAVDAANRGKHIYLEKPMAVFLDECDEMLDAARQNNVKLMTAHTQRYFPTVRKMKEIAESKRLGELIMAYEIWHKPLNPYARPPWMLDRNLGGGMGQMDGTHLIDRLLWIFGNDVASVSGITSNFCFPDVAADDTGMCLIRWESGKAAAISRIGWETGVTEYGGDYFFTSGQARYRNAYGPGDDHGTGVWIGAGQEWRSEPMEQHDPMTLEFREFIDSLNRGDDDTPVPQIHGRNVMAILDAWEQSHASGKEVTPDIR